MNNFLSLCGKITSTVLFGVGGILGCLWAIIAAIALVVVLITAIIVLIPVGIGGIIWNSSTGDPLEKTIADLLKKASEQ